MGHGLDFSRGKGSNGDPSGHDESVDALELIVDEGRPASAGRFFQLGVDLLALLDEASELPVEWTVTHLETGSALAVIAPPEYAPAEARHLRAVVSDLDSVAHDGPLPDSWTPDAVKAAHRFVAHGQPADVDTDWVPPRLRLVTDDGLDAGPSVSLTPHLLGGLETLQPFEREMPGSVRGTLVGVNVSRGNRASLLLPDRRVLRVSFPTSLREAMRDALLQDVELAGTVRQDGDGRVFKIRTEEVDVLIEPEVRWSDIFGAAPDFTGGMPADEWLKEQRGQA